jgi:hypothetical protein
MKEAGIKSQSSLKFRVVRAGGEEVRPDEAYVMWVELTTEVPHFDDEKK